MASTKKSGMDHRPAGEYRRVVEPGEFPIAAIHMAHSHLRSMCAALVGAGAEVRVVYDPDPAKLALLREDFPDARVAASEEEVLDDPDVKLVAAAAVPSDRGPTGERVMRAGKDYFTDKCPFTTLAQLESARATAAETGRKFMVYYGERLHNEAIIRAGQLIHDGAIGRVIQIAAFGPHRLEAHNRPDWFFRRERYGGIICDLGSHQAEKFLHFAGSAGARVLSSSVANYGNPDYPELEDFGQATLAVDGATCYFRVDWFTPDGLRSWGDARTFVLGTKGYLEVRAHVDVARGDGPVLNLVDGRGERSVEVGTSGFPFFGDLILDCLERTENAMTQERAFLAAELSLRAQAEAEVLTPR